MALTNNNTYTARNGLLTFGFDQSAAGSDDLVAAPAAGLKIVVTGYYITLDTAGTIALKDGTVVLGGTQDCGQYGAIAWQGTLSDPIWELTAATKLAMTTTGGAASGFVIYRVVPA